MPYLIVSQAEKEYDKLGQADILHPVSYSNWASPMVHVPPRPTDVSELRSFLGMINYYSKCIKDFSSKLHPLYELLSDKTKWLWSESREAAFLWAKEILSIEQILVHNDPNKPLIPSVDATSHGIGAVLSHEMEDGSERPVKYASRTLNSAEKNYARIEREGLAIVFAVKRVTLYLYGRKFKLVTDHQPLTCIFGPKSGIPPLAAARLQRWALLFSGCDYDRRLQTMKMQISLADFPCKLVRWRILILILIIYIVRWVGGCLLWGVGELSFLSHSKRGCWKT